eukprot:CAMPEP_0205820110 /NCGR_PEP_ID=MMETSP0206-20130828/2707_1 /ASSEMBLY_ACC=CAM_ASM_000279 /TAXON_ID=36767 /ORGANISM="Euplotes focardii, Strain TN1" /LENGTH=260 /DNA_ID=CAMNT_0053114505 /DNA_START=31 /DNA_END=813 /DNA_ORIENTATION=+
MADRYARILGTEEDKVNCPFYYKIGACRHGDRCSRTHLRPHFSQTLLMPHLYLPPPPGPDGQPVDDSEPFEDFYEEILDELAKFGELEEMHVLENLGDHMFGNVYIKFHTEEEAEACLKTMSGRYYAGRLVAPEYSPVTDFREARCRQFDEATCNRGGYCNFMHLKYVPRHLRRLVRDTRKKRKKKKSRSRSRGRDRDRKRSRSRGRDRDRDRKSSPARDFKRSGSEERRAKIAAWNKDRSDTSKEAAAPAAAAPEQKEA